MRLLTRLICLPAILASLSSAQELRPVSCRFLWFDHLSAPPVMVNLGSDGAEIRCEIPGKILSSPIRCFAEGGLIRFLKEDDRSPCATAKISPEVESAILVFLPGNDTPAKKEWRVFVIDDSSANFPYGGAFVANLYGKDIRFVIGEHRNQLRAGSTRGVKQPAKRDAFNMAPVIVQFQQGESWRTASESSVRFIPDIRYLILAYVDQVSGRPRIATFTDVKPIGPSPAE